MVRLVHVDGVGQLAGAVGEVNLTPNTTGLLHKIDPRHRLDGANQNRTRRALRLGHHIQQPVHAVDEVHVRRAGGRKKITPASLPGHRPGLWIPRQMRGVTGGVVLRVGFRLDDAPHEAASRRMMVNQPTAEQVSSNCRRRTVKKRVRQGIHPWANSLVVGSVDSDVNISSSPPPLFDMSGSYTPNTAVIDATFQTDAFDDLSVNVPGAHVHLRPHDEDRIHLRGSVPNVESERAQRIFHRKNVSTHQSGNQLSVTGEPLSRTVDDWRWRQRHRDTVRFELHLPPPLNVTVNTPGGAVDAAHLDGRMDLSVSGGSVTTEGLTGPVQVQGSGGSFTARNCSGGRLDLHWTAGEVVLADLANVSTTLQTIAAPTTVEGLQGPSTLSVQGGPLTLRNLSNRCEAEVRGGALTYSGAPTDDTELRVVGGPLQTHLPSSHAARLTLTGARVTLDDGFAFEGDRTAHRIEGALNGGGPHLQLCSVNGPAQCTIKRDE